jgi:hypothetical protein
MQSINPNRSIAIELRSTKQPQTKAATSIAVENRSDDLTEEELETVSGGVTAIEYGLIAALIA